MLQENAFGIFVEIMIKMHKYFTTFAKLIRFTEFNNNNYFAKFSGFCKVKSVINFLLQILCITFEKLS